ncbi:hypothetical protein [Devosia nitrariae]|uniref:Holliday junction nuclease RuvC n=1 Tax=Devosia nitrariae TaxID=2071872 RepID=A0ABQ5W115_9HYPH|nr:hypothetical protein [Devosia nitrariae]GLQ53587.1 hypothetical protein GCM10010862_08460 [Devosia nitrariae]
MSTLLILDTATKTGYAVTRDGILVEHGLLRLDANVPKGAKGDFQRQPPILLEAYARVADLVDRFRPDFIVAEIPHLRGASSFLTVAIYGVVELVAAENEVGFYGVHTASWQSRIIPAPKGVKPRKGDTKDRSIAHVRDLGLDPETDDVADAICIAEYAHTELRLSGDHIPFSILTTRRLVA